MLFIIKTWLVRKYLSLIEGETLLYKVHHKKQRSFPYVDYVYLIGNTVKYVNSVKLMVLHNDDHLMFLV